MKCPYCRTSFFEEFEEYILTWGNQYVGVKTKATRCPACSKFTVVLVKNSGQDARLIVPDGATRDPAPPEVPADIAQDYVEACLVLPKSAKASAALARRCLQHILHAQGYAGRDLSKQIEAFSAETDPAKIAPLAIRDEVDSIRNFGNFSAHPITDKTTLQVIDVEPHEAEQCLEIIETLFSFFYVQPAEAKRRRAALNAKLEAGGKPPAKGG